MKRRHLLLVALSLIISVCMCLALAGCGSCGKDNLTQLAAPVVTISKDGTASWTADENASGYAYKIDNGEETATDKTSVKLTDGQSIVVQAKGDGKNYSDSEWSESKTYTKPADTRTQLDKPVINIGNNGLATWSVENAVSYLIKLDGGEAQSTVATSKQLGLGQTIQVQALANSATHKDSEWSDVAAYTIQLEKPVIRMHADGTAEWSVEHADKYSVIINDDDPITTEEEEWTLTDGDTIQVQALGDGKYYTDSPWSDKAEYEAPDENMTNIEKVEYALKYIVIPNPVVTDETYTYNLPLTGELLTKVEWTITCDDNSVYTYSASTGVLVVTRGADDIDLELTATVSIGEGADKASKDSEPYAIKVLKAPKAEEPELNTHAEYLAANNGDKLTVKGVVTGIAGTNIYLQDNDGGYYVYKLSTVPADLAVGKTVIVSGSIKIMDSGLREFESATVEVTSAAVKTVEATDITSIVTAAEELNDKTLLDLQGMLVTIKGVTLDSVGTEHEGYYIFTIGGHSIILFINGTQCIDSNAQNVLKGKFAANLGKTADITGFVSVYDNKFQLAPYDENTLDIAGAEDLGIPVVKVDMEGWASWADDPNAEGYDYVITHKDGTTTSGTTTDNGIQLADGDKIKVKAKGDGVNYNDSPDWSEEVEYEKIDDANITSVTFDFSDVITESKTSPYKEDGAKEVFDNASSEKIAFSVDATNNVYPGDGDKVGLIKFSNSGTGGSITLTFTKNVKRVVINAVAWQAANGNFDAATLAVNGGTALDVKNTAYSLIFDITPSKTVKIDATKRCDIFSISIYFDDYKETLTPAPEVDIDEEGLASWEAVPHAEKYVYVIDDGEEQETSDCFVQLSGSGKIKVKAVANGYIDSAWSTEATYTAVPVQLEILEPEVDNEGVATWKINLTAEKEAKFIKEYVYKFGAEGEEKKTNVRSVKGVPSGTLFHVKAIGTGRYVSTDFVTFQYDHVEGGIVLGAPTIEIAWDGTVTLSLKHASGFAYKIGDAEEFTTVTGKDTVTLDATKKLTDGQKITAYAKGDGEDYLDGTDNTSELTYTAPVALAAPTDVKIDLEGTTAKKVIVSWTAVDNASGYSYRIDDAATSITVQGTSVTITLEEGQRFKIKALGNAATAELQTNGNYSAFYADSVEYVADEFDINDDIETVYTVSQMVKIAIYYGETSDHKVATDKVFNVEGVVSANGDYSAQYFNIEITLKEGDITFGLYRNKYDSSLKGDWTAVLSGELIGSTVTAKGKPINYYGNTPQFGTDGLITAIDMSAENKVKNAAANLKSMPKPEIKDDDYTYTLPVTGKYGTTIAWTFEGITEDDNCMYDDSEGTLVVFRGSDDIKFTAIATITYGTDPVEATETKRFEEIEVAAVGGELPEEEYWVKVNSVDDLKVNDIIVLAYVSGTTAKAMAAQSSNGNFRDVIELTGFNSESPDFGTFTDGTSDKKVVSITIGSSGDTTYPFTLKANDSGKYFTAGGATSSGGNNNNLTQSENADSNASKWQLGTDLIFKANVEKSNSIKYNSTNPRFSAYASGQNTGSIYKLMGGSTGSGDSGNTGDDTDTEAKVTAALEKLSLQSSYEAASIELQTSVDGVNISWTSSNESYVKIEGNKANILCEEEQTVTLTATAECSCGTADHHTKAFAITVKKPTGGTTEKEQVTYTADFANDKDHYNGVSSYLDSWTGSFEGLSWNFDQLNNNGKGFGSIKAGQKSNATTSKISVVIPDVITSITISVKAFNSTNCTNVKLFVGEKEYDVTSTFNGTGDKVISIPEEAQGANLEYRLEFTNKACTNGSAFEITKLIYGGYKA